MEARLLPVNTLLGLCQVGGLDRSPLADAGFRVEALEVPVGVPGDRVVVDVVLSHAEGGLLLACESKSGANIEPEQAKRYATLDPVALVLAASVDVKKRELPEVAVLYACLEEHAERIVFGLDKAGVNAPVLAVGRHTVRLLNPEAAPTLLADVFAGEALVRRYPVPRIVPCDHESDPEIVCPQVEAVLIAHLSRRTQQIDTRVLAHETLTSLAIYGDAARNLFVRKVEECVRGFAARHPQTYEYARAGSTRQALVRLLQTPEDNDPRGRTQAYQAFARPRHTRPVRQPQTGPDLLDLLGELGRPEDDTEEGAT